MVHDFRPSTVVCETNEDLLAWALEFLAFQTSPIFTVPRGFCDDLSPSESPASPELVEVAATRGHGAIRT